MAYRRRRGTQTDRDVAGRLPTSADPLVAPDPNRLQIHYDREWNEAVEDLQEGLGNYERNLSKPRRKGKPGHLSKDDMLKTRPGHLTEDDLGLIGPDVRQRTRKEMLGGERGRATKDDVRRALQRYPGLLSPVLDPERGRATEDDVRRYLMYLESIGLGRQ